MQINFSAGQVDIRIAGVSTYLLNTPGISEISALFDQYRLNRVITRFDWSMNAYSSFNDIDRSAPLIQAVIDYDDSANAILTDIAQYPNCLTHSFITNGYKPLIIPCSPRLQSNITDAAGATALAPTKAEFIRTSNLNVPHYGIKLAVGEQGSSSASYCGYMTLSFYLDLECINPK